jgi:hypothetical protein
LGGRFIWRLFRPNRFKTYEVIHNCGRSSSG